jgi:NitT/TauT family transport system ATP-binding protein
MDVARTIGQAFTRWHPEAVEMSKFRGAHIKVDDLHHRYRNSSGNSLEAITVTIEPGEAVALLGRSGCGKSTLLHIVAGLVRPTSGCVHIDGRRVEGPSPSWVMMFQQPSLYPWMSVTENVAVGLRFAGRMADARTRVPELLELVELSEFADRNVQDLSGGQQQRVALARSLALKPDALLLDEPFSALDAFTRASLQRDVRRITRELGITLVLVTHEVGEAALMCDRALIMAANPGRVRRDIPIGLGTERSAASEAFQRARRSLIDAYEIEAGMALDEAEDDRTRTTGALAEPRPPVSQPARHGLKRSKA